MLPVGLDLAWRKRQHILVVQFYADPGGNFRQVIDIFHREQTSSAG